MTFDSLPAIVSVTCLTEDMELLSEGNYLNALQRPESIHLDILGSKLISNNKSEGDTRQSLRGDE